MLKAYLFIYSQKFGDRQFAKNVIDQIPEIVQWRYDLPNTFYLISELTSKEIHERIISITRKKGRYLISEISENRYGLLPRDTWHLLRYKERPKKP